MRASRPRSRQRGDNEYLVYAVRLYNLLKACPLSLKLYQALHQRVKMRQEFDNTHLWHKRGYLPHYDAEEKYQMITYRLADSLPKKVAEKLYVDALEKNDPERRKYIEGILDRGYGSCILENPEIAEIVKENWHCFDKQRYDLLAYVIMPNHVHILIKNYSGFHLSKIIHSWKSYTSKKILAVLNAGELPVIPGKADNEYFTNAGGPPAIPGKADNVGELSTTSGKIWQDEYWDRFIRDEKHFQDAINYIHNNPVKAGLVKNIEDWFWSSAAN